MIEQEGPGRSAAGGVPFRFPEVYFFSSPLMRTSASSRPFSFLTTNSASVSLTMVYVWDRSSPPSFIVVVSLSPSTL